MLRNSLQRRLRMEMLEDKRPLAANLFAEVVNGDLIITGDAGDNRFYMQLGEPQGEQYEIGNLGDFTDKINGEQFNTGGHFFSGVTGDVIINLGDGDDWIQFLGENGSGTPILRMPRDLRISMGGGDDRMVFGMGEAPLHDDPILPVALPVEIARDLTINMGAGFDQTWMSNTTIGRDVTYTDSQGDAFLQFFPASMFDLDAVEGSAGRDFSVVTGGGNDYVAVENITTGRNLVVTVGAGDDFAGVFNATVGGSTLVNLGSGSDIAELQSGHLGSSLNVLGSGSNVILMSDLAASLISIITATGSDHIEISGVQTGTAIITTGAQADELYLVDNVFDNLLLTLGGGNDTLSIGNNTVNGLALLLGGGGFDTVVDLGDNEFGLALALAFESWAS